MKKIFNSLLLISIVTFILYACKKDEQRAVLNQSPVPPVLTASSTSLVIDSANAANTTAVTFSFPAVDYGAKVVATYTLQIDSANDNFVKPVNFNLGNSLTKSFTAADFNTMAISLGILPTVAGKIIVRVKADVNQSNGVATTVPSAMSNVINLTVTPYSTKPQPKYPVPDSLYIVGDATPGGWPNPVPTPSQKFTKIDDNTFGIVLQLTGGKAYLLLPKNGDWSHKYAVAGTPDPMGGAFVPDASNNIPAPAADGLYTIIIDFVKGTYTLTAGNTFKVPAGLFIVGDATPGGWDNPVPVPTQQFTQTSSGEFSISIPLTTAKSYLLLPVNGSWDHKYGGASSMGGALLSDSGVPNTNTPAPGATGTYNISVNFFSQQYKVSQ